MNEIISQKYSAGQVTDSMHQEAAVLFNENYGNRVRLSKNRLRTEYLLEGAVYVRAIVDGKLAGNAFACRWTTAEKNVLWITQLVVHRSYRERGIARRLLDHLVEVDIEIYGLISSHPAACVAAARLFARASISNISLECIGRSAEQVIKSSPVSYVKDAKLRGNVFDPFDTSDLISSVDTGFFVEHTEPLEALGRVKQITTWPLGNLLDGHEFLVIMEHRRSRPRSLTPS